MSAEEPWGAFSGLDPAQHRAPVVRDRRLGYGAHRSAGPHLPGVWWRDLPRAVRVAANFVPVNTADDFLDLILGIGMIGLGLAFTRGRRGIGGATS